MTCVREAPSQPACFPVLTPSPDYPFQMLVADITHRPSRQSSSTGTPHTRIAGDPQPRWSACLPYKYTANADWCVFQELKERMMAKSRKVY